MTFNRTPGRDPELELKKIRKRFRAVTFRVEVVEFMRKLTRFVVRAAVALALFALVVGLLLYGLGFRW